MRLRLALALSTLAAVLGTLVAGAPAQAGRPMVRVLTFNACGNVCRAGEVTLTSANIAYRVRALHATVTMLQELCYSQFLGVKARLAPFGYAAEFATAASGGHCDDADKKHGKAFGVAVIARGPLVRQIAHQLPSPYEPGQEGRVVLGVTARLGGRTVLVVTTHLARDAADQAVQLRSLQRWLTPYASSEPVLFGGDLNLQPDSPELDGLYTIFREADHSRADPMPTFIPTPRKIDYLFGSRAWFATQGVAKARTAYSDHYMYLGAFR